MILLIDVSHVFHKSYYVFKKTQPHADLSQPKYKGILIRKVVTDLMASVNKCFNVEDVIFCFDDYSWRKKKSSEYKAHRSQKEDEFYECMFFLHKILIEKGYKAYKSLGAEADDCIMVGCHAYMGYEKLIVSGDEDTHQLIDSMTTVWNNNLKKPIVFTFTEDDQRHYLNVSYNKINVDPELSLFTKVLLGCNGDGVSALVDKHGVGPKTIEKLYNSLLEEYSSKREVSLENRLEDLVKRKLKYTRPDFKTKLKENQDLVTLHMNSIPERVYSDLIEELTYLIDLEPIKEYSMKSVLNGTEYFSEKF